VDHAPAIAAAVETLSAPQKRAWASALVHRLVRLLCGRQAGKTRFIALWLLVGGLLMPESVNVYLSLTKESAKRNVWPELRAMGALLGLEESCFKWHGGIVTMPNGSTVLVVGTDDKAAIEAWRGPKLFRVAVDEMGAQPPEWVAYLITEILWWTVMRNDGSFLLAGNPGLICDGYWWTLTRPDAEDGDCLHQWDVYENPGIPHAAAFVAETMMRFGWTEDSPGFIRSVRGRWVRDATAVVYPFDDATHGVDALPTKNDEGFPVPASSWVYTFAANVQHPERVGWAVLATNPAIDGVWVVEGDAALADPDQHAQRIEERLAYYRERTPEGRVLCVVDPGELGEAHVSAMRSRHRLAAVPADNGARKSAIRVCRGALMGGAVRPVRVVRGERTRGIRDAWNVLGWHPSKRALHNPAQEEQDQIASAAAFGYRATPRFSIDPRAHVVGSRAWHETIKDALRQRVASRDSLAGPGRLER
jgi:hypothetical protein